MQAVDRTRFDGLFDLTDLEKYLFIVRPAAGDLRIVWSGQLPPMALVSSLLEERSYDFQAVFNGLSEGFTVVLNAIHARWPEARRLTMALEDRLQARVQANVYITGQRGQGFAIHQDDHDVFVLQTCGTKRWMVYDRPAGPLAGAQPAVLHEIELKTGDALYLPIGYPHAAETADDYSIHVSVGVFPWTWQDLARDCLELLAAEDPRWQERVPLAVLRGEADPPPAAEIEGRLREGFQAGPVADHRPASAYRWGDAARDPPSGYAESVRALDRLDVTSEVERRPASGATRVRRRQIPASSISWASRFGLRFQPRHSASSPPTPVPISEIDERCSTSQGRARAAVDPGGLAPTRRGSRTRV
jgi:hypothetical protein